MDWVLAFNCTTYGAGLFPMFTQGDPSLCPGHGITTNYWTMISGWTVIRDIVAWMWGPILATMLVLFVLGVLAKVTRRA